MTNGKILLVDDEPGVRDLCETILSDIGCEFVKARTIEEAQKLLHQEKANGNKVKVIVSDYDTKSELNGADFYRSLRNRQDFTPFVFVTSYAAEMKDEFGTSDPNVRYYTKPLEDLEVFQSDVSSLFGQ